MCVGVLVAELSFCHYFRSQILCVERPGVSFFNPQVVSFSTLGSLSVPWVASGELTWVHVGPGRGLCRIWGTQGAILVPNDTRMAPLRGAILAIFGQQIIQNLVKNYEAVLATQYQNDSCFSFDLSLYAPFTRAEFFDFMQIRLQKMTVKKVLYTISKSCEI